MGTPLCFSAIFTKGKNFCGFVSASLDDETVQKWGLLLNENFASVGANSILM